MNQFSQSCTRFINRYKSAIMGAALFATSLTTQAQTFYGLAGNTLVSFTSATVNNVTTVGSITGLVAGQSVVGLDFRPATGQLYALGYDASTGAARLYTIDRTTAAATAIGTSNIILNASETAFGFDFNPTVDRIRLITASGRNYRLHPNTGAIVANDGNLAYAAGDINATNPDAFVACAYTNSYIGSTSTALYDIGATTNSFVFQNPPNNGTLNTVGSLGITINNTSDASDMDIYFDPATATNMAYLSTKVGSNTNFYGLNTTTGAATLIGTFNMPVADFSAQITPNMPAQMSGPLVYGITTNNYLVSFDAEMPNAVRSHLAITGLTAGQVLAGMDVRPATGEVYVLGYNATNGDAQLYTLNPSTAALSMVAMPDTIAIGLTQISFDFNPTVDRIRLETSTGQNYRLHPATGVVVAVDGMLSYAPTDMHTGTMPRVGAAAYTNSFGGTNNTKLYVYDDSLNIFALQNPPNNGVLNTIGSSSIMLSTTDMSSDMDVYYDHMSHMNTAYFVANTASYDKLYRVNLADGMLQEIGMVGNGIALKDIAVRMDSITTTSSTAATISPSACNSYTAPNGTMYNMSGAYTAIIPNMMGYDSLITINLTINMIDSAAMPSGAGIMAAQDSAMYQWIDCATNINIPNATNQTYIPTATGSYSVMVTTAAGCMTTSDCIAYTIVALDEQSQATSFKIYPNPATTTLTIETDESINQILQISDALGRNVLTINAQGRQVIDISALSQGLYFVKIGTNIQKLRIE